MAVIGVVVCTMVPAIAAAPVAASPSSSSSASALPPAPRWTTFPGAVPQRPASCPALTPATEATTVPSPSAVEGAPSLTGDPQWPVPAPGSNPERYAAEHTPAGPPDQPSNWATDGNDWKLASGRSPTASVSSNPQELCGVEGNSVDSAWQVTTGRPTTVLAVLDSGIDWCSPGIVEKIALNRAALPPPEDAAGRTKAQLAAASQHFADADPYDLDGSGVLDTAQYAQDPRVAATVASYGGTFCATHDDGYTGLSPEDLIRTFATATLPDGSPNPYGRARPGPAGFAGAVAGWNFIDNNDDPYDDVAYGHGTGEALDMAGAADNSTDEVGACPDCMILPVRVGTSFIATGNAFAQGVLFAVDSGATVVSEALGATDETETDVQAIAYAAANGVPIVGSAADEESEHANLPGAMNGIIDVNSVTREASWTPASSLYLNGCTNYGPEIAVSVESASCSSEATGKTSGVVGLIESAAADALAAGRIRPYPGLRSATGAPVALSANEVRQLVTMSADDVDFATAAPDARPAQPADNYAVHAAGVPLATTTRYPTTPGYDIYTGWGRLDAARAVQWVAEGRIPPEAAISSPGDFQIFPPAGSLTVRGTVGAVRAPSYRYQVDVAPGPAPSAGAWRVAAQGAGRGIRHGVLATLSLAQVAALFPGGAAALTGGAVTAGGQPDPDRFTFSVRVVVRDARGLVGVAQAADFLHADPGLLTGYPRTFPSSLVAPPKLAPLGPGGADVLVVAQASGTIDALLPDGKELPGWPVHTALAPGHWGERAYRSGAVTARPRGEVLGGVAVGDLAHAGGHQLDVVATDMSGTVYAWNARGQPLPGWPRHADPAFSQPSARDAQNRLLPGFLAAPALGDLTGNGQLDVVAASMDRHVYAFAPDGRPVAGWPVLVIDPSEVASVDPVTNHVTFLPGADPAMGTELVDTPAIGRLDGGSGPPDVVVGSDEEYLGAPDADLGALGALLGAANLTTSNARVYAIYPDGSDQPAAPGAPRPPGMPDPGAFLPGWPAKVADLDANLLPTIGDGVTTSPALADVSGTGTLDVVTGATAGPIYVLRPDGTSAQGTSSAGLPEVTSFLPTGSLPASSVGILNLPIPALGSPVVAPLGQSAALSIVAPAGSVGRLLDELEPGDQSPHQNQVVAWTAATGAVRAGFPAPMNDLQFETQPLVADVGPPGTGSDVVGVSGLYDLRAYEADGTPVPGFPKFTGGWVLFGPVVGAWGPGDQVLAVGTRSGELLAWHTDEPACASPGPWPQVHHDAANTQNLAAPRTGPSSCR